MQMKKTDIPVVKAKLLAKQGNLCKICKRDLTKLPSRDVCLDHNHSTWMVRAVLCRQCNSLEAKVKRSFMRVGAHNKGIDFVEFLKGLIRFQKVKDTKYRYPVKKKKKRAKK
jgi:hypothetical protein